MPGLLAERISPSILAELAADLPEGSVLVTGTNGKTTTCLALHFILQSRGYTVLRNKGGSNLTRGLVSALVDSTPLRHPHPKEDLALFEVDEATMPLVTAHLSPRVILVTNIFRDQLDRYGEIDATAALIRRGLNQAASAILVLNADDPRVAALGRGRADVLYYGLADGRLQARTDLAMDAPDCPVCDAPLVFQSRYFSHLGHYGCERCGFARPESQVTAQRINVSADGMNFSLTVPGATVDIASPLTGLYNVYNMVAAVAVACALSVPADASAAALSRMRPAFGRLERFDLQGRTGVIHLVKNPTGFNQVIENVCVLRGSKVALLCLNDNLADGTDISWIWDVDFGPLAATFETLVLSGIRAPELALRLKYAGATDERLRVTPELPEALDCALALTNPGETLHIMSTYTAMLELRSHLVRHGVLAEYWK